MSKHIIEERVKYIFETGSLISLATVNEEGPWASVVHYVSDENLNIYWLSDVKTRHSTSLLADNRVAGTITVSDARGANLGLQIAGQTSKIEGNDERIANLYFTKRNKPRPNDNSFLDGGSWYVLKPTRIELIDGQNFGHNRQTYL